MRAFTGALRAIHFLPIDDQPRDGRRRSSTRPRRTGSVSSYESPRPISSTPSFEHIPREADPKYSDRRRSPSLEEHSTTKLSARRRDEEGPVRGHESTPNLRVAYPIPDVAYKEVESGGSDRPGAKSSRARISGDSVMANTRDEPAAGTVHHTIGRDRSFPEDLNTEIRRLRRANDRLQSALEEAQKSAEAQTASHEKKVQAKRDKIQDLEEGMKVQETHLLELRRSHASWEEHARRQNGEILQLRNRVQHQEQLRREDRQRIDDLVKEREQAIANRLKMDVFDSSVDRVSEAQLVGVVQDINSSIDEFVSTILEDVNSLITTRPPTVSSDSDMTMFDDDASPLLTMSSQLVCGGEGWGLLLDCLLHQKIVEILHKMTSSSAFGVPIPGGMRGEMLMALHTTVSDSENWRATQRWRSVTAKAVSSLLPETMWTSMVGHMVQDIQTCLATATHQPVSVFSRLGDSMQTQLGKIAGSTRTLFVTSATDMVSVRIRTAMGTEEAECMEVLWPEMDWKNGDKAIATYSLGLMKVDEQGKGAVLLKSKVATQALLRFVEQM